MVDAVYGKNPLQIVCGVKRTEMFSLPAARECGTIREKKRERSAGMELYLELRDTEWEYEYTDHDRTVVRAIVFDDDGFFLFVRADRDDDFGRAITVETAGGGLEPGESLTDAVKRELLEELGAETEIVCKLGVVSDYYNLIHRHNINHYYLCKAVSFGERALTEAERDVFHLSTLKLRYADAVREYGLRRDSRLGRLLANRELPVLRYAGKLLGIDGEKENGDA